MAVQKQTYTLAEFEHIQESSENRDKRLELIDGEIVERAASSTTSAIAARLIQLIRESLGGHSGSITSTGRTYILSDANVFIPDIGVVTQAALSKELTRFAPSPPDMAVEVKSPRDSRRALRMKAEKYLSLGTRLVWLVFPDEQIVEVYVPGRDVEEFSAGDALDGSSVLPELSLHVRRIFTR